MGIPFNEALQIVCSKNDIKQADICKKTGWSRGRISNYFSGRRQMSLNDMLDMCNAIEVHPLVIIETMQEGKYAD